MAAAVGEILERRRVGVRACGENVIESIRATILTMKNKYK
jgi:hypothetical protein